MADDSVPAVAQPGLLLAIGGAEDKLHERAILRHFLHAAGGPDAAIVVLATASELPDTGERYADLFYKLNADVVDVLRIGNREDAVAAGPETLDLLEFATGLFITGGSQLRLSSAFGGTPLAEAMRRRHRAGMVVAGTSAGAAFLSEHMIAMGDSGATPRRRLVQLSQGLGLTSDMIIDQHFKRRDRLGRLLTALSYNPAPLGVGVDENTAAVVDGAGVVHVLGEGAVTIVDARDMRYTDCHAVQRGQALAMLGVRIDLLTAGCRYDISQRRSYAPLPGEVPSLRMHDAAAAARSEGKRDEAAAPEPSLDVVTNPRGAD